MRLELGGDARQDLSAILRFHHLLERHHLMAHLFDAVQTLREERRLLLRVGRMVDATIIATPRSPRKTASSDRTVDLSTAVTSTDCMAPGAEVPY